jgi:hypothetical protein
LIYPNQRMIRPPSWNDQNPTNEPYPHPLESLERLLLLPESQVIIKISTIKSLILFFFRLSIPRVWLM